MATKVTKTLDILPNPPSENINSHFILGEIIDHIDLIKDEFPNVKIHELKSHLWDIRNHNVDPEIHLRGFLKVFEETEVFKSALAELDDGLKTQIKAFIAGGGEGVVLAAGGKGNAFHLPPSPPARHHFGEFVGHVEEKIEGLLHHDKPTKPLNGVNGITNGHVEKSIATPPRIFEDKAESKTMEVSQHLPFTRVEYWRKSCKSGIGAFASSPKKSQALRGAEL